MRFGALMLSPHEINVKSLDRNPMSVVFTVHFETLELALQMFCEFMRDGPLIHVSAKQILVFTEEITQRVSYLLV